MTKCIRQLAEWVGIFGSYILILILFPKHFQPLCQNTYVWYTIGLASWSFYTRSYFPSTSYTVPTSNAYAYVCVPVIISNWICLYVQYSLYMYTTLDSHSHYKLCIGTTYHMSHCMHVRMSYHVP